VSPRPATKEIRPAFRLLAAQQRGLSHDERLDTLALTAVKDKVPALPVAEAIVSARVRLTIDGPCTLTIDIEDPLWLIERSGMLDRNDDGRLDALAVAVDKLRFRLVDARRRTPQTLTLEFEDEAWVLMDQHTKRISSNRGTTTRPEFILRMVREVRARDLAVFMPESANRAPVARPDLPDARPHGGTGFDAGTTFKIKGQRADAQQMKEVATALTVADQENATDRPRLALLVSGMGESGFRDIPNSAGSPYGGVFQALKTRNLSTQEQARYFLKGGQGFQAGGAIAAAREHPDWSPGTIAYKVEGSRANFPSDAAAEHHYEQHRKEAERILKLWNRGDGARGDSVLTFKQYRFTRGRPGVVETSTEAGVRLAREVNWRFYAIGGVVCFVSDARLITQPAWLTIDGLTRDGEWHLPDGLLEWPTYSHGRGKLPSEVSMRVTADAWGVPPGEVMSINNMGPISGRWIIETFEFDLLDATDATVDLIKPVTPRKEPAPDVITTDTSASGTPAGAKRGVKWAVSKIGHYREEFGSNRGEELDALEQKFGFSGAPWCAMFATTAAVEGGAPRECRTASVADINRWCEEGSHGYQRGFRATPKPGDLMTFDNRHVGYVEKVNPDGTVGTIEGNTSAGKVARLTRKRTEGKFVRPDYPT
jgi:hypothetical protein